MNRSFYLLIAVLLVAGCSRHSESAHAAALPPVRVAIAVAKTESLPISTDITGTVRPVARAQVAAKVMGTIDDVPVALGQSVRAGDLLVRISAGEISARVIQARSQLSAAQRDLDREQALLAKGASTPDMVKGLEDRFTAAQAMVREAETMLAYTALRAPFDGVVARKMANVGDLASPGYPLLELQGTTDFQVEAGIPDSLAGRLTLGATLRVTVPASGGSFDGTVAEISSAADAGALTVLAKIRIPTGVAVRSGQFARVAVPGEPAPMLLVPATAVSLSGQMQRVFVAETSGSPAATRAVLRLVKTGGTHGDRVEILAGITNNEWVIVAPPVGLTEGQPVQVE